MHALSTAWQSQVKEFFDGLHGHQSKTLALFVEGAMAANSMVVQRVAEALLPESEASASSIERRLERFLSNPRIDTHETWDDFLSAVMPFFRQGSMRLVIDLTSYKEHAQVIYLGLMQHSRVLPLVWKVMPGQTKWDQGLWECIEQLCERLVPHLGSTDCTLIGDSAFGCFPMVSLCQKYHWHYVFRICAQHTCQRRSAHGSLGASQPVADLVSRPGKHFYGSVRLWQEDAIDTHLSAYWDPKEEEALLVISDRTAGPKRLEEYRLRWKVEATFQDLKSRGWDWEESHVRRLDRVDRMLLVMFVMLWWLTRLAACCMHNGHRARYDRADRRDKSLLRLGRLYWLDVLRHEVRPCNRQKYLVFQGSPEHWTFILRF
jgi:Transposase DDE domain